jgi:cholesterol oxidase
MFNASTSFGASQAWSSTVAFDYDVLVIGSGFGGGVSALRLSEKGYRVGVLEAGRDYSDPADLPKNSMDARRFLWLPKLRMKGIFRITLLRNILVFSGSGVGGGSLTYANTLYRPLAPFYTDAQWGHITDWEDELEPYYDQAERMLGVNTVPFLTEPDRIMRDIAEEMGVGETFHSTPVGVYFGKPGVEVEDPYFGGEGPSRTGCIKCGDCMSGCKFNAKNTVDKNYLWLARGRGAKVHAEHQVTDIVPLPGGGYRVVATVPGSWLRRTQMVYTAEQVVCSAAALGTQKLLHRNKDNGNLPQISNQLGHLTRTNSEAILGAQGLSTTDIPVDMSVGVAIGSSFHPDEHTHVEPVRYGKGSNLIGLGATVMTDGDAHGPRALVWLKAMVRNPGLAWRSLSIKRWAERTVIVLVMQTLDNSIQTFRKRTPFGTFLSSREGHGEPNPRWIPVGNEVTRKVASRIGGWPGSTITDSVFNIPSTAHFIGGCAIGDTSETGVIDPYHRVFGHEGLHVVDGSAITANLGVNPSLTITAMSERALAMWPNKGDQDPSWRRLHPCPTGVAWLPRRAIRGAGRAPATTH